MGRRHGRSPSSARVHCMERHLRAAVFSYAIIPAAVRCIGLRTDGARARRSSGHRDQSPNRRGLAGVAGLGPGGRRADAGLSLMEILMPLPPRSSRALSALGLLLLVTALAAAVMRGVAAAETIE